MGMLDPLKPYLTLIKWVVAGVLALLIFAGGWNCKGNRDEKEMGEMQQTIDAQLLQLKSLKDTLDSVNEQTAENMKVAEEARKAAEQAVREAGRIKADLDRKQAKWEREFDKIKNNPDCKELMERKLCPLITDF